MRRALVLGLLALNAVAAVVTLTWAKALVHQDETARAELAEDTSPNQTRVGMRPISQILARYGAAPLFRKDRAFAAAPQTPITATARNTAPPQPVGTLLSNGADKWVLLLHPQTKVLQKVALGETFAGWDIKDISETSVTLQRSDRVVTHAIRP